jgi:hypothetical protein
MSEPFANADGQKSPQQGRRGAVLYCGMAYCVASCCAALQQDGPASYGHRFRTEARALASAGYCKADERTSPL